MDILSLLVFFIFLLLFGFIFVFIYFYKKLKTIDFQPNANIVLNFDPELCDGHYVLLEQEARKLPNQRWFCKVIPRDLYYDEKNEKYEEIKSYEFVIEKGYRRSLVKGNPSRGRNIVLYLPNNAKELPDEIRESELGQWIDKDLDLTDFKNAVLQSVNKIKQNIAEIMINYNEMPEQLALERAAELTKEVEDIVRTTEKGKRERLNVGLSPYPMGFG